MTIRRKAATRKQRFEAALKKAEMSGREWRSSYYKVSWQHLNECFAGRRVMSAALEDAIERFIKEYSGAR